MTDTTAWQTRGSEVPVCILEQDGVARGFLRAWYRDPRGCWVGWVRTVSETGRNTFQYIAAGALSPAGVGKRGGH
jgi:hypothetical protein